MACIQPSQVTADKIYAATGKNDGSKGGFFVSTDRGATWTLQSRVPIFNGTNTSQAPGAPSQHPRSTGRLIALDEASSPKRIYAGTFKDGVMRSTDDGASWDRIGLKGKYIRTIVIDPSNPDIVYVGTYGDKAYKTTSARSAAALSSTSTSLGTFSQLTNAPDVVEEFVHLGGTDGSSSLQLYAACNTSGVYRVTSGGSTWTPLGGGTLWSDPQSDPSKWSAIDGFVDSGVATLYVSCENPHDPGSGGYECVMKSTNSGSSFSRVSGDSNVDYHVGGSTGPLWWLSQTEPDGMLNHKLYVGAQIAIDPGDHNRVYIAGKSGGWRTTNGGTKWYPVVHGLEVTINRTVVYDPNTNGRAYIGNVDWTFIASDDHLATVQQVLPPGSETVGYAIGLDQATTPSGVYVASGDRDNNTGGEVYYSPDPLAATPSWTSQGLASYTGGNRPFGYAYNHIGGAKYQIAAVEGSGIWRKVGTGAWNLVNSSAMTATTGQGKGVSIAWVWGSSTVYVHDRLTGLWRSNSKGASGTWTNIWSSGEILNGSDGTGYLVADPSNSGVLYVSTKSHVCRLDGVDTGTQVGVDITQTNLAGGSYFTKPGPISLSGGTLYAIDQSSPARLIKIGHPDMGSGDTPTNEADSFFESAPASDTPKGMTVTPDGYVYVTSNGAIVGN